MRIIRIGDDMYVLRGSMKTSSGYSVEEIKKMHGVDSVLKKDDKWFAANIVLDAEFEDIKLNKKQILGNIYHIYSILGKLMDKFFEKLFAKIADFHQREAELSQSLVDNKENLPYWLFEENQKHDFYLSEFLWANKKNLPNA